MAVSQVAREQMILLPRDERAKACTTTSPECKTFWSSCDTIHH